MQDVDLTPDRLLGKLCRGEKPKMQQLCGVHPASQALIGL